MDKMVRNVCPRNCYGSCSMLTYVNGGKITKVSGDPDHGYSKGKLCAKGYSYTQYVYNSNRLKYPMMQYPRKSGKWKRISWEYALNTIALKMIEFHKTYGSNLAVGYNKFFGNMGLLHFAVEAMFNSIGPHTKTTGNTCLTTGYSGIKYNHGTVINQPPEKMAEASLIVLWGANPAVTNIQQLKFIFEAKKRGAKLVVIDPVFTETAMKADLYIQIKPGTDAMLALGIMKQLILSNQHDQSFINQHVDGWNPFKSFLLNSISFDEVSERTGVSFEAIEHLAQLYGSYKPAATWAGFGIQRYANSVQTIRAIDSLVAICGNYSDSYHGMYYVHMGMEQFPNTLLNHQGPSYSDLVSRELDMNTFSKDALQLKDPPLKLLWIAGRNPITQDQYLEEWNELTEHLDLIVTVDLFMTKTAEMSDIILPTTTHFEEYDLNVSYWHHWLALNQKAINPYYEARSDLQIARDLTKTLNDLCPGFSNFPYEREALDWINLELSDDIRNLYHFSNIDDLYKKPYQMNFNIPEKSRRFKLFSQEAKKEHFPALPVFNENHASCSIYPLRLLTPQSLLKIHSQFNDIEWLNHLSEDCVEINEEFAKERGIDNYDSIFIFNRNGSIKGVAKLNKCLPKYIILMKQAGHKTVNQLISHDIPSEKLGNLSTPFYDIFVDIKRMNSSCMDK